MGVYVHEGEGLFPAGYPVACGRLPSAQRALAAVALAAHEVLRAIEAGETAHLARLRLRRELARAGYPAPEGRR